MLNKVMLIGRLGQDPQLSYSQAGKPFVRLNLATGSSYVGRDGERVQTTEWHRVVLFDKTAENVSRYLSKGSLVYIEGSIHTRKWQDQNGTDRYTTEINGRTVQFLERRRESKDPGYPQGEAAGRDYTGNGGYGPEQTGNFGGSDQGNVYQGYASGYGETGPVNDPVSPSEGGGQDDSKIDKIPF